jgi:hypothetical protein
VAILTGLADIAFWLRRHGLYLSLGRVRGRTSINLRQSWS